MSRIPRLESSQQIEVPREQLSSPGEEALKKLGITLQLGGKQIAREGSQAIIKGSIQQGSTALETRALIIKEEAAKKFNDPADQKEYFNKAYQSYAESYIARAPGGAKNYLNRTAQHGLLVNNVLYDSQIQKQNKLQSQVDYYSHQQNNQNNLNHALSIGDFGDPEKGITGGAQKIYQQIVTSAKTAATAGIITPGQMNNEIKSAQKNYQAGNFLFHVQQSLDNQDISSADKLVSSVEKNGLPSYSPTEVFGVTSKAKTLINDYKLGHAVNLYQVNQNAKDNLHNARHTGRVNQKWTNDFVSANPKKSAQYLDQLNENLDIFHTVTELTSTPIGMQQERLAQIKETENFDKFSAINNDLRQANIQINDDPYSFFLKNKVVEESLLQHARAVSGAQETPFLPVDQLVQAHPTQSNLDSQRIYGIDPINFAVMPKSQAKQLVAKLDGMSMQDRVLTLEEMQKKYGENSYIALSQLNKAGMPLANQMALAAINRNSQEGSVITRAFSVPFHEIQKIVGEDRRNIDQSVDNALKDYLNTIHYNALEPSKINNIKQSVQQLAYQLNIDGESTESAAQDASDIMINAHYNYTTLVRNMTRLPKEVNDKQAKELAASMIVTAVNSNLKVPPFFQPGLTKKEREFAYKQQVLFNGDVVTNENDSGLVVVSPTGDPVLDENDNRINIPFDDFSTEEQLRKKKLSAENRKLLRNQATKHLFDRPGEIDVP